MDALTLSANFTGRNQRVVLSGCQSLLSDTANHLREHGEGLRADFCDIHRDEIEALLQGPKEPHYSSWYA